MPLLDHFRPPVSRRLQWHSFHHAWATTIAYDLNARLPDGFVARPHGVFGIEIDVAALRDRTRDPDPAGGWAPPAAVRSLPFAVGADQIGVLVFRDAGDLTLAAAVELVSPRNKDRPTARDAFVGKCLAYLAQGAGVVVVDVVTERTANLHNNLVARIAPAEPPLKSDLYAVAYRPTSGRPPSEGGTTVNGDGVVEVWPEPLAIGRPLPELPLWLLNGPCVRLDLEALYEATLRGLRVAVNGTNGHPE